MHENWSPFFVHFGVSVVHIANDISLERWNKLHLKLRILNDKKNMKKKKNKEVTLMFIGLRIIVIVEE